MARRSTRTATNTATAKTTTRRSTRATSASKAAALAEAKPAEAKAAPADIAEVLDTPLPEVVRSQDDDDQDSGNELRKRELIDLVVARSDVKKKYVKPAVEAMLAIMGEAISEERDLNLQPLGKLKVNRSTDKGNGQVIICKLRRSTQAEEEVEKLDADPLAEVAE
ncbi:HU family DNA-binding protein [Ruegeria sp. 1NDH52C]|uniref:HU family DNA-binding protein n=1 Tax=Ruegeria alba TaxID=2916756 RepID=A0ABS9NYM2_9RHOB|nr:HU family DNA-binding protein [Ruegeria alba]MCG6559335.1 HU family DNA-binding protein [Ruegeria alba]